MVSDIFNDRLVTQLDRNNTLISSQHGFRRRRGTVSLLGNLYERIAKEKGQGKNVLVTL